MRPTTPSSISSLSYHAYEASNPSIPLPAYSPTCSTSALLRDPAVPDVESSRHKEADPAPTRGRIRRAWQTFKSLDWRVDSATFGAVVFCALLLACTVLICFGLNFAFVYAGGRILHYTTNMVRTDPYSSRAIITPEFARVAFAGSAIVNGALVLLVPAVTVAVKSGLGTDAAAVAWWGMLALGMLAGSATAAGLGVLVVPPHLAPEELSAAHAFAAGGLGTVVVGIPILVLGGTFFVLP